MTGNQAFPPQTVLNEFNAAIGARAQRGEVLLSSGFPAGSALKHPPARPFLEFDGLAGTPPKLIIRRGVSVPNDNSFTA